MAMRKLGNVLPPLVVVLVAVVPPEPALLLLLLPHADAISARPTAREAAVASHFHECLRFNFVTSRVPILVAAKAPKWRNLPRLPHSY
jgi:hypothetical protein